MIADDGRVAVFLLLGWVPIPLLAGARAGALPDRRRATPAARALALVGVVALARLPHPLRRLPDPAGVRCLPTLATGARLETGRSGKVGDSSQACSVGSRLVAVVARGCAGAGSEISKEEAIAIAAREVTTSRIARRSGSSAEALPVASVLGSLAVHARRPREPGPRDRRRRRRPDPRGHGGARERSLTDHASCVQTGHSDIREKVARPTWDAHRPFRRFCPPSRSVSRRHSDRGGLR